MSNNNERGSLVTALYLRLSCADEIISANPNSNDSDSIKNQRDLLTAYVANQWDLCETKVIELSDDGYSGTNFNRPGVQKLLGLVRNGGVNCIVVKDFSRFGRNYIETCDYIEQIFPLLGVRFISVNDGYDSEKEDMTAGNISVAFMNLIHDLYSKDLSEKVRTGKRIKWEMGENSTAFPIYGYEKSKTNKRQLVVDEEAAVTVRQIFSMAVAGTKPTEIARILNRHNISTPNSYKINSGCAYNRKYNDFTVTFWNTSAICRIISDERYTGKEIHGKKRSIDVRGKTTAVPESEWFVRDNAFDSVVSKEIFSEAQKVLWKHSASSKSKTKPHMKIRCGNCGRAMKKCDCKTSRFFCETPSFTDSPDCVQGKISGSKIKDIVFDTVHRQIELFADADRLRKDNAQLSEKKKHDLSEKIQGLQQYLRKLAQDRMSFYESYTDEQISREAYLSEREKINSKIYDTEKQIQALELEFEKLPSYKPNPIEQKYCQFFEKTELTQEIINYLVDSVIIYSADRIEIRFKTADEFNKF